MTTINDHLECYCFYEGTYLTKKTIIDTLVIFNDIMFQFISFAKEILFNKGVHFCIAVLIFFFCFK